LAGVYSALKRHHEAIGLSRKAVRWFEEAAAKTHDDAERRGAASARVDLAITILNAAEDPAFRAAAGERLVDARAALRQAAPAVPNQLPGQKLSPADQALRADFETARGRLARLK
jgi:hypothetical protein